MLGLACLGSLAGAWLKKKLPLLDRLSIPPSIIGGLIYAVLILVIHDRWPNLEVDTSLRDLLMIAFFTTIGMQASLRVVAQGGRLVLLLFGLAIGGLLVQLAFGVAAAKGLGLQPLVGLIPGAMSLTGGPATSLAFGPLLEKAGVEGASALGLASAIAGILISGLLSGWIGSSLIAKNQLQPGPTQTTDSVSNNPTSTWQGSVLLLGIAMGLGSLLSAWIERAGITLPAYIGAMIVACVIRNLADSWVSAPKMTELGNIALELFIVMAMIALRTWEIVNLAAPVLVILLGQVLLTTAFCRLVVFPILGRDHQAAVATGGYSGFMLGITANAVASMREITRKHGPAPQAILAVGIVGGFLIDFANALVITQSINLLR
jgi:ESS family glutamate:Na+ symporter